MTNFQLLICAATVCAVLRTEAATETISALEGSNVHVDCVRGPRADLMEPPPGCIVDRLQCSAYRGLLKYLCYGDCTKPLIETYMTGHFGKKHTVTYRQTRSEGILNVTIAQVTSLDDGVYECGLRSPLGHQFTNQFKLSVIPIRPFDPKLPDSALSLRMRSSTIDSGNSTVKKPSTVAKVVRVEEGQSVTIECPLEHLASGRPPTECFDSEEKCGYFFRPLLYLHQEQGSKTIITYGEYVESERFSLKYGERFLTVGIASVIKADSGRFVCGVETRAGKTSSLMFELIVGDVLSVSVSKRRWLLLLLLIPALLLLTAAGLFFLFCCKKRKSNSDHSGADASRSTEVPMYENLPAPSLKPEDTTYQTLSAETRDQNQIYCSLNSP